MVLTLFAYMVFFSFAYITLSTGTGALILFGAVQLTMFGVALRSGERFGAISWAGLSIAFAGLIYLVSPGVTAPDPLGGVLLIAEDLTTRLVVASVATLGGVWVVLAHRPKSGGLE